MGRCFLVPKSRIFIFSALSHPIKSCGSQVPVAVALVFGARAILAVSFRVRRPTPKVIWPATCVSLNLAADSVPSDGILVADTGMKVYPPPLWSFTTNHDQRTEKSNSRQFAHGNKICGICGLVCSGAPLCRGDDHWLAVMGYPASWAVNAAPGCFFSGETPDPQVILVCGMDFAEYWMPIPCLLTGYWWRILV